MAEITRVAQDGNLYEIRDEVFGLRGAGVPASTIKGTVGQLYEDTTNGKLYICTRVNGNVYTWEESGAKMPLYSGTGQATDGAMTQKAVTAETTSLGSRITSANSSISTINGKIPSAATSSNQLADKNYVGNQINTGVSAVVKTMNGAPTTSTVGTKGQLCEDTANGRLYVCTNVDGNVYTWEEAGGSAVAFIDWR